MNSTLDKFAHSSKQIMSKHNQKLNKHAQKLIATRYIDQRLNRLLFLILKSSLRVGVIHADAVARSKCAGEGGGVGNSVKKKQSPNPLKTFAHQMTDTDWKLKRIERFRFPRKGKPLPGPSP
jgi:hypothetical protein